MRYTKLCKFFKKQSRCVTVFCWKSPFVHTNAPWTKFYGISSLASGVTDGLERLARAWGLAGIAEVERIAGSARVSRVREWCTSSL